VSYIPLRDTAEFAIESGMRGTTKQAAQAAHEMTVWWVAEVNLTAAAVAGNITRARDHNGWRLYRSLSLSDRHTKWTQHRMDAVGLPAWAEWFLRHRPVVQDGHAVCLLRKPGADPHSGKLWGVSASACQEYYCAACWNYHFQCAADESVFLEPLETTEDFDSGFLLV